jgi:hypothetical protein
MAEQWKDFVTAIGVPKGVAGYLDWTTGLMRINTTHDVWQRIVRTPDLRTLPRGEQGIVETVTHETIHFLQIATTSFLYGFAVRLFEIVKSAIQFPVRHVSELPTRATPPIALKLRAHFAALDAAGPENLTVRSLAEGQAMLAQLRTHWRGMNAGEFLRRLTTSGLPPEYSRAYVFAHKILGDATFESYPLVSSMALCTAQPAAAFVALCEALRHRGIRTPPSEARDQYLQLVNELNQAGKIVLKGTSAEVLQDLPEHPVYTPMVHKLNEIAAVSSIIDYMTAPHRISETLAVAVARPAVYNAGPNGDTAVHVPDNWRPDLDRASRDAEAETMVLLMSVSASLLNTM